MRFRAAHLACVLLLLSTMGAAEAHAQMAANAAFGPRGHCIGILLQQGAAVSEDAFPHASTVAQEAVLPGSSVAHIRGAWTMRPPAAHTLALHAVTGSGL